MFDDPDAEAKEAPWRFLNIKNSSVGVLVKEVDVCLAERGLQPLRAVPPAWALLKQLIQVVHVCTRTGDMPRASQNLQARFAFSRFCACLGYGPRPDELTACYLVDPPSGECEAVQIPQRKRIQMLSQAMGQELRNCSVDNSGQEFSGR